MTVTELAQKLADIDPLIGIDAAVFDEVARATLDRNFPDGTMPSVIVFLTREEESVRIGAIRRFVQRLADGVSRAGAIDAALFPEGIVRSRWQSFLAEYAYSNVLNPLVRASL